MKQEIDWREVATTENGRRNYMAQFHRHYTRQRSGRLSMPPLRGIEIDRIDNLIHASGGTGKWLMPKELECLPAGSRHPIIFESYGAIWQVRPACESSEYFPSPEELAQWIKAADACLERGLSSVWHRSEGQTLTNVQHEMPDISQRATHFILERTPWEVEFHTEFDTHKCWLGVYGRFGTIRYREGT
jgi:hypothetical protein